MKVPFTRKKYHFLFFLLFFSSFLSSFFDNLVIVHIAPGHGTIKSTFEIFPESFQLKLERKEKEAQKITLLYKIYIIDAAGFCS